MTNPPPDIASIPPIRDYETLRKGIAMARRARGMSQLALDYVAGLASGHTGKLECGTKGFGPLSLSLVLEALGITLAVQTRTPSKPVSRLLNDNNTSELIRFGDKKLAGRKGGIMAGLKMNPQAKRARARKAAKSRWARARARKKANAK